MPHISHIVSCRFTIHLLGKIGRQLVKAPLAAAQPMDEMIDETRDRPRHREQRSLLFSTSAWVL